MTREELKFSKFSRLNNTFLILIRSQYNFHEFKVLIFNLFCRKETYGANKENFFILTDEY